jgi:hypothetical protein
MMRGERTRVDVNQGLSRISLLARYIMFLGPLLGASLWLSLYFLLGHESLLDLAFYLVAPFSIGAAIRLLAWIAEGFASPMQHHEERRPG